MDTDRIMSRTKPLSAPERRDGDDYSITVEHEDLHVVRVPDAEPEGVAAPHRLSDVQAAPEIATRARYRWLSVSLICSDALCLLTALITAYVIRFGVEPPAANYALLTLVGPVIWVGVFHAFRLYSPHVLSAAEEFRRTVSAAFVGMVLLVVTVFSIQAVISRAWIGLTLLLALLLELATRRAWHWYRGRLRSDGRLTLRTLIMGSQEESTRVARTLGAPGSGFHPLGYIDVSSPLLAPSRSGEAQVKRLREVIRGHGAECVFVASPIIGDAQTLAVAQAARLEGIELRVFAHLPFVLSSRLTVHTVGPDGVALALKPVRVSRTQAVLKRAFDIFGSVIGLVLFFPLLAAISIAIKLTSPGPALFRQQRVTEGGRMFDMYKFRTMRTDTQEIEKAHGIDPSAPFFKMRNDPRLTRVGGLLRRLSLDELPQLFNVLRGNMSLVGPRALAANQVAANLDLLAPRHEVRAGVTGWWQINGRSDVSLEEAVRMDLFYIENWSLALDLYILLKTIGVVLRRRGAY
jgi:exopolysaccharide biosynthesis polyprenyl glycosylphosphotransferase